MDIISAEERRALAEKVGLDEQYLYQCLTGRKDMRPKQAVRVERESGQRLRVWHLRSNDWFEIWPHLIGTEGAPAVPQQQELAA